MFCHFHFHIFHIPSLPYHSSLLFSLQTPHHFIPFTWFTHSHLTTQSTIISSILMSKTTTINGNTNLFTAGVEKVNFFLGPQTENKKIFCQNPKVPPTLRARETSFIPHIPCYHLPFKNVKGTVLLKKCKKLQTLSQSL